MLNYTTKIKTEQTVGEVTSMLAKAGAASVSTLFDNDGSPDGLGFSLRTPHGPRQFVMHVNIDGVHRALLNAEASGKFRNTKQRAGTYSSPEHAGRVAWRVVKDFIEAQVALIEAEMASLDQVMLPYLVVDDAGGTLYAAYQAREQSLAAITE